jgi:hypothetical protein
MTGRATILWMITLLGPGRIFAQNDYTIAPVDFNSRAKELGVAFFRNGLVFCSDRRTDFLTTYTDYSQEPLTNLYFSEQKKNGGFSNPSLLAKELTTFMYEGPACFSADKRTIFFTRSMDISTRNKNKARTDTTLGIFTARNANNRWGGVSSLNFNSNAYNTAYPCISEDGNTLFFCSDMPDGKGGYDIYSCSIRGGNWGKPVNLGPNINTAKNEVFPYFMNNGKLYFASRGLKDGDDLDIYYTWQDNGEWQKPIRLPVPFNSNFDDYGVIFNPASDTGYFVSNRNGNADIFAVYSGLPAFANCPEQKENDYCFVFYESNSGDVDTVSFAYEWNLGDGTKINAIEAEHCFAQPGTYHVELNIIDKITKDVMVSQASYDFTVEKIEQPYIAVTDTVTAGVEAKLTGRESFLKNTTIQNYYWDFGDGSRFHGADARHTWNKTGTYSVVLGVTGKDNSNGDTSNCISRKIVVVNRRN